jgi:hypothetical protein
VVLTPRCRRQVGGRYSADDGDKKARSPGRARRKPLKPLRAGMPGDPGGPVVTTLVCFFHFAREAAGALGTRHSPRPLFFEGSWRKPRVHRAARMRTYIFAALRKMNQSRHASHCQPKPLRLLAFAWAGPIVARPGASRTGADARFNHHRRRVRDRGCGRAAVGGAG